jgi:hypothetical protein
VFVKTAASDLGELGESRTAGPLIGCLSHGNPDMHRVRPPPWASSSTNFAERESFHEQVVSSRPNLMSRCAFSLRPVIPDPGLCDSGIDVGPYGCADRRDHRDIATD